MKKLCFFSCLFLFFSCKGEKYIEDFYSDGSLKAKVQVNDKGIQNGIYEEYYQSGKIKVKGYYKNGKTIDTFIVYYQNGVTKEKGYLNSDFLKNGWWSYYDSLGTLRNKNEYIIISDSIYKNQSIHYDEYGKIIDNKSSFFKIDIPDTLNLGWNAGILEEYHSDFDISNRVVLHIVIENYYPEIGIKKDTFAGDPYFGIFQSTEGRSIIKGEIIEKNYHEKKGNNDLFEMNIYESKKYFEKEVYVKNK